jgi:hypothetical protein
VVPNGVSLEITAADVMLSFEWNSLRSGDAVIVHDDLDPGLALAEGVVTLVEPRPWDTNDVAIRIDKPRPDVVRPRAARSTFYRSTDVHAGVATRTRSRTRTPISTAPRHDSNTDLPRCASGAGSRDIYPDSRA